MAILMQQDIALENCPACGGVISSSAEYCPHCWHPIGQLKRQARIEKRKQDVADYAHTIANKGKPMVKKFARIVAKVLLFLFALIGLAICTGAVTMMCCPAPANFIAFLWLWTEIGVLPAIKLSEKLFGLKAGFIIGRLLLILQGGSSIGVCEQLRKYYFLMDLHGNNPTIPQSVAYGISACIAVGCLVRIWNRTNRTKQGISLKQSEHTEQMP